MPSFAPARRRRCRSQASAISRPPATAKPSIAAMSGLRDARWTIPAKPRSPTHGALAGDERLEVHARAEALAGAGEHADLTARASASSSSSAAAIALGDRQVHRVARVGAVERDEQDAVAALGEDSGCVGHAAEPSGAARMNEIADDVWHIPLTPRDAVNAYVLGDVLVDAGIAGARARSCRASSPATRSPRTRSRTRTPTTSAARRTSSTRSASRSGRRPATPTRVERGRAVATPTARLKGAHRARPRSFPPVPIARRLHEGDEVGGFTVLDTPGHSPGHISFWRESDRVARSAATSGSTWTSLTLQPGPARAARARRPSTPSRTAARMQQARSTCEPAIVGFGHGPVHDRRRGEAAGLRLGARRA